MKDSTAMPEQRWTCPNCDATHVTVEAEPHTPFHPCRGLHALMAPFVPDRTRCKIVTVEREDYVNDDRAVTDSDGRPVMAIVTVRDDGQDCAILAPTASGDVTAHGLG